jgi:hypothetical protein
MQLINTIYTLLTLTLLLLIVNYFGKFVHISQSVIVVILILSAIVFSLRMYMRYSSRNDKRR